MDGKIILVIGAYGFIGSAIARALAEAGCAVRGLGRSAAAGRRRQPDIDWIEGDLRRMTAPENWSAALAGVGGVVNAAGVLQDGARDRLTAVHETAVRVLVTACEAQGVARFVQISATGASADAATEFFRSKARGDAAVRDSTLQWVILRPGLVIGPDAYGGTALLRGLAAIPLVQPLVLADAPVQTVALGDVARATCLAATGKLPPRTEADLVTPAAVPLGSVVSRFRAWLGFAPARHEVRVPAGAARVAAAVGDALGWLGWRPPLRSTALAALAGGVRGDPETWRRLTGERLPGLAETLAGMPATVQERRFARLYFAMPLAVATLALVWLVAGLAGIWQGPATATAAPGAATDFLSRGIAAASIGLGLAVLVRPWARRACLAMAALGLAWPALHAGTATGPAVAALGMLPAAVLALIAAAMLDDR